MAAWQQSPAEELGSVCCLSTNLTVRFMSWQCSFFTPQLHIEEMLWVRKLGNSSTLSGVVVHTFNPSILGAKVRQISVFRDSLVYVVSSGTVEDM